MKKQVTDKLQHTEPYKIYFQLRLLESSASCWKRMFSLNTVATGKVNKTNNLNWGVILSVWWIQSRSYLNDLIIPVLPMHLNPMHMWRWFFVWGCDNQFSLAQSPKRKWKPHSGLQGFYRFFFICLLSVESVLSIWIYYIQTLLGKTFSC